MENAPLPCCDDAVSPIRIVQQWRASTYHRLPPTPIRTYYLQRASSPKAKLQLAAARYNFTKIFSKNCCVSLVRRYMNFSGIFMASHLSRGSACAKHCKPETSYITARSIYIAFSPVCAAVHSCLCATRESVWLDKPVLVHITYTDTHAYNMGINMVLHKLVCPLAAPNQSHRMIPIITYHK